MDTSILYIICNILTALLVIYFIVDGWTKGALYMLVLIIRLFGSYFIARFLSSGFVSYLMTLPVIRSHIATIAAGNQNIVSQMVGAVYLFTGSSMQSTLETVAYWILYALTFAIIFAVLMIVFAVLLKMTKAFNEIPVLGTFNRIIGAVEGLFFGIISTLILVYIMAIVIRLAGEETLSSVLLNSWLPTVFRYILYQII